MLAVRWYLRYGLSYRDVEELLAERGIEVDHVSIYRWVQRFTPLLIDAARPCRHSCGDRWFVDETYLKISGRWRYLYRAIDQFGQVIDVLLSDRRDAKAARRFFTAALSCSARPAEVTTDGAPVCIPEWSRRACLRLATSSSGMPTTPSRPTTAGSRPGCGRCEDSNAGLVRRSWSLVTRSSRTCGVAITNLASTCLDAVELLPPSPSS